jgi:hypothetical protein
MKNDTFPAGMTDAELIAYIEGEADVQLAESIEQSEALSQRARQLAQEINWLKASLFRRTCPDADELGDFHLGLLPRTRVRAIEGHLPRCPYCVRELAQYRDFLGDPPTQPGLAKRIVIAVARLLDSTLPSQQALAPAYALRGEGAKLTLYEADGWQISLDVQEDVERPGYQSIIGVVTGPDAHTFSVDLWQEGEHVDTAPVDKTGGFTLPALLPGVYELIIKGTSVIVHIQSFSL